MVPTGFGVLKSDKIIAEKRTQFILAVGKQLHFFINRIRFKYYAYTYALKLKSIAASFVLLFCVHYIVYKLMKRSTDDGQQEIDEEVANGERNLLSKPKNPQSNNEIKK